MAKRIFIYGSQGSGSSFFAFYVAQIPESGAILDLWSDEIVPRFRTDVTMAVKCTVGSERNFRRNMDNFRPDTRILLVRNPTHIYQSLSRKSYRDVGGKLERKLSLLDAVFADRATLFDMTVRYEDFIPARGDVRKQLREKGLELDEGADRFSRSMDDIITFSNDHVLWCRMNYLRRWGHGNIHLDKIGFPVQVRYPKESR